MRTQWSLPALESALMLFSAKFTYLPALSMDIIYFVIQKRELIN